MAAVSSAPPATVGARYPTNDPGAAPRGLGGRQQLGGATVGHRRGRAHPHGHRDRRIGHQSQQPVDTAVEDGQRIDLQDHQGGVGAGDRPLGEVDQAAVDGAADLHHVDGLRVGAAAGAAVESSAAAIEQRRGRERRMDTAPC